MAFKNSNCISLCSVRSHNRPHRHFDTYPQDGPRRAALPTRPVMHNIIQTRWRAPQRKLPGVNCIAFADDNLIILDCRGFYNPNNGERTMHCTPLCDTTIASLEKYDAVYWTLVDPWASLDYRDGKIYGGDGQMGHEGFIACADAHDELVWAMFFENTNPIKTLAIQNRMLVAVNEHDELRIEIDLANLTDIKMTYL